MTHVIMKICCLVHNFGLKRSHDLVRASVLNLIFVKSDGIWNASPHIYNYLGLEREEQKVGVVQPFISTCRGCVSSSLGYCGKCKTIIKLPVTIVPRNVVSILGFVCCSVFV